MLAKSPEDRYLSLLSVQEDLLFCWRHLFPEDAHLLPLMQQELDRFEPGMLQISSFFHIPRPLYGREESMRRVLEFALAEPKKPDSVLLVVPTSMLELLEPSFLKL